MEYALLFPGQGSQYKGMYSRLLRICPETRELFQEASEILGFDLALTVEHGSMATLTASEYAQPAVVAASCAFYRAFSKIIKKPPVVATGHSLGEISACIAAEAMSFSDGIRFVGKRSKLMARAVNDKCGGAGIVVDFEQVRLERLVETVREKEYVTISGYNSPRQFIVAGSRLGLETLEEELDQAGGQLIPFKMIPMKADAPYHSLQMEYLKEELMEAVEGIQFNNPKFPIWSTVSQSLQTDASSMRRNFEKQLITPVYWNQVLKQIAKSQVGFYVDMGPGEAMRNLVCENPTLPESAAFDSEEGIQAIADYLK